MSGRSQHSSITSRKILYIGIAIGLGFWLFETVLHQYIFDRQSFREMLLPENVHELWMRSLVTFIIIGFGYYAQIIINKLNESRQQYQDLFENAPDGIFLADIETGRIIDANPVACRLLGRPKEDVVGLHQSELHPPSMTDESTKLFNEHIKLIRKEENPLLIEHILLRSDGTHVPIEIAAQIVHIRNKSFLQGIFRDLTERKKIQDELENSNQRFKTVLDGLDALIYVCDIDTHEILFTNKYGREHWGEIVGKTCWQTLQSGQSGPCGFCTNDKLIGPDGESTGIYRWEFQNTTNERWYDCHDQAIRWIDGRLVRMEIATDITERKKAEHELRASEERLSEAQRVAQIGNWSWNLKTNELYWSEENYRMFGLSDDVVPSYQAFIDTLHPEDLEYVNTCVKNTLENREPYEIDYRIILPDGSERIIHTTGKVDYDKQDKPSRFFGTVQDVTERRKQEERLRRSEEKYRTLFEHAGDYILVLEIPPAGIPIIRDANESALRIHGYTQKEMLGQPISLVDTEVIERAVVEDRIKRLLNNETLSFEAKHRRKDGTVFDIEISAKAIKTSPSLLVVSIERDITERKKIEQAVNRQARLLESIRHAQSMFIAGDDPKPVFDSLLETLVDITDSKYGFLDEVRRDADGTLYKKSLALSDISWDENSHRLYEQLESSDMEFRNMGNLAGAPARTGKLVISNKPAGDPLSGGLPKGHPSLDCYMGIPVFFAGELVGVAGVANRPGGYNEEIAAFLDTFIATCGAIIHEVRNERKEQQITSALRESEERYRRIVEDQSEFLVRWLPDGTRTFVNESYCRYFGIPKEQAIGTSFFPLISGNFSEFVRKRIESATPENPTSTGEHHIVRPDGTTGWNQWTDTAIFNDEGELVEFQSVGRDITDRKLAEERQKMATYVLELLNKPIEKEDVVGDLLLAIQKFTGLEAVGIRLRQGEDFPYYVTSGFSEDFIKAENQLCSRTSDGDVSLECMCGNVICGRTNQSLPFFTEGGSFWANSTTELLASTCEQDLGGPTRNRCNTDGYESVALIPLSAEDEIVGLLQLNDHRAGMFTVDAISFFEGIGASIGIAIKRKEIEESLQESEKRNFALFDDAAVAVWEEDFSQVKEHLDKLRASGVSNFRKYFAEHPDDVAHCAGVVRVLNVNKASVSMLKAASKEELLVHLPDYFNTEETWAVFREELAVLAEGQTHFQGEIPIRCQNGEEMLLDLRLSVLSGYEISLEHVYVSFVDITARKHAEYELIKSEENYRNLYEGAPLGYQSLDSSGNFLDVNQEWLNVLGYSKEEVIGRCFSEFLAPEFVVSFAQKFPKFKAAGKMRGNEFEMIRKDGSRIFTSFAGNIEYDAEGNFKRTHCIMHDITEQKRTEEKARQEAIMREVLLNNLPCIGMILKKGTREIVASNEAARKLGAVPGKTCYETCAERDDSCPFCLAPDLWEDDKPRRLEVDYRDHQVEGIWVPLNDELYAHYIFDISERKKAEQALIESENKYRAVVENAGEGIVVAQEGMLRLSNPPFSSITGYSQDELLLRPFMDYIHPEDRDMVAEVHRKRLAGEDIPSAYEIRIIDKHGNTKWLENSGILIEWEGRPASLNFLRDVTDRRKAEESLRESEERFRGVFENSLVGLYRTTPNGQVIMANEALAKMLGFPSIEKLIELNLEKEGFEKQEDRSAFKKLIEEKGQVVGLESAWKKADGTTLYVRESSRIVRDENGNVRYYEGTVEDITDRKTMEKRLLEERAQLKSLASQLSLTEEHERHRLATDLHDQIGQSLVLSKIKLDLLQKSAADGELTGALEEVCGYLAQVIADTRTLTFDLSSPILYEMGLEAAIAEWLTDEVNKKYGIATEFHDDNQHKPIEDDIRTILFRNVRELLINAVKHAKAQTVKVSISRAGESVIVCVEDDGAGFDPVEVRAKAAKKAKFGLFSIRERLEQLGGKIEIESSPGKGCKIIMTAPLKKTDIIAGHYN